MSEIPGQSGHSLPDLQPPVCAKGGSEPDLRLRGARLDEIGPTPLPERDLIPNCASHDLACGRWLRLIDPFALNRDAPVLGDTTLLESVNRHRRKVERFALVGRG